MSVGDEEKGLPESKSNLIENAKKNSTFERILKVSSFEDIKNKTVGVNIFGLEVLLKKLFSSNQY